MKTTANTNTVASEAMNKLVEMGFTNQRKNERILSRVNGDVAKAAEILERKSKKDRWTPLTDEELARFDEAAETLVSKGFPHKKWNIRVLKKVDGDVAKAAEVLEKRSKKQHWTPLTDEELARFDEAAETLVSKGFPHKKWNLRILKKVEGDVAKAAEILERKSKHFGDLGKRWGEHEKRDWTPLTNEELARFDEAAETLVSKGFPHKRRNIRILKKVDGDVAKASEILEERKAKMHQRIDSCRRQTATEMKLSKVEESLEELNLDSESLEELNSDTESFEELNLDIESPLKEDLDKLSEAGFSNEDRNVRLLNATGGKVDVVQDFLSARQKLRAAIHEHQLERKRKFLSDREERKAKRVLDGQKDSEEANETEEKVKMETERSASQGLRFVPQDATRIFLDGSNLVYQLKPLSRLAIEARQVHKAETILEGLARKLTDISGIPSVVLFDETSCSVQEDNFVVESSSPSFRHSGEALMAKVEGERHPVVVTADCQLGRQLLQKGVTWLRPLAWLNDVIQLVEPNRIQSDRMFGRRKEAMSFLRDEIARQ